MHNGAMFHVLVSPDIDGVFILGVSADRNELIARARERKICCERDEDGVFVVCEDMHGDDWVEVRPLELDPSIDPEFALAEMKRILSKRNQWYTGEFADLVLKNWNEFQTFTLPFMTKWEQWKLVKNA